MIKKIKDRCMPFVIAGLMVIGIPAFAIMITVAIYGIGHEAAMVAMKHGCP